MRQVLVIARFELVRLFGSRRGWWSLLAFGLVWSVLLYYVIGKASVYLRDDDYSRLIGGLTGNAGVQNLLAWPVPELTVFWGLALYLFPIFCIVVGADQTASDRSRGTLRLISLRATRDHIFFGRFLGQMLVQTLLVAATIVTVLVMAVSRDSNALSPGLSLSVLLLVNLLIVLLPFTGLMALVSVISKSARQATVYATILLIALFIFSSWLIPANPSLGFVEWMLPGMQLSELLEKESWDMLSLAPVPLLQTFGLLLVGRTLMRRSNL